VLPTDEEERIDERAVSEMVAFVEGSNPAASGVILR